MSNRIFKPVAVVSKAVLPYWHTCTAKTAKVMVKKQFSILKTNSTKHGVTICITCGVKSTQRPASGAAKYPVSHHGRSWKIYLWGCISQIDRVFLRLKDYNPIHMLIKIICCCQTLTAVVLAGIGVVVWWIQLSNGGHCGWIAHKSAYYLR